MSRSRLVLVLMLGLLVVVSGVFAAPKQLVVGCLEPLTGSYAVFGTEAKIGMEIAIQHINAAGGIKSLGGATLKLVAEDCGESPDTAKLSAESLISKNKPVAILGLYISRLTIPVSEVTDRNKVILVADALADNLTQIGRRYLFRPSANAGQYGASAVEFVVDIAKKKGVAVNRVAIINEDSSFGHSVAMGAVNAALKNKLTIVYQKEYPYDLSDATAIVSDIVAAKPDVVFHCPYFMDAILFAKTIREGGRIPKFVAGMGACGYADANSIESMGETANFYTNTYGYNPEKDNAANKKFVADFKAKFGILPEDMDSGPYVGAQIILHALEATNGDTTPATLLAALTAVNFEGPEGLISFDPATRCAVKTIYIAKVAKQDDGAFVWDPIYTYTDVPAAGL